MKRRNNKAETGSTTSGAAVSKIVDDDHALFRNAMQDVAPLPPSDKVASTSRQQPLPIPRRIVRPQQTAPDDSLSDHISMEIEAGDEWSFLSPGVSRQTLRRLRRGHWPIQAQLDLHGFTRDDARLELVTFLNDSQQRGFRCVRVIHGKGLSSKDGEPVLKSRIGSWLSQREDVLAFCQAKPADGGSGAVLVLLKTGVAASMK